MTAKARREALVGPQGPRPRRWFAPSRVFIYSVLLITAAFVLFPLYVMIITSLKDMDQIRAGGLFDLPARPNIDAWIWTWDEACTGLLCEGLKVGFWTSVKIAVPSVTLSIFLGSVAGYVLALWRYRGATVMFTLLLFCIFVPPQVILYPLSSLAGVLHIMGTLQGVIAVNTIIGIPFMALLFRNAFAALPPDMCRAARVDGAGFWRIYWEILLPLLKPIIAVAVLLQVTYIWGDYFFSAVFGGMEAPPMTMQFHNIVNNTYGISEPNVDMAATILTAAVPLIVYFALGRFFVRGIATGLIGR